MKAEKIFLGKAKQNKLFYFVANVVIFRESDKRCLILKRSKNETAHPGKWCVPGGKLEWKNLDLKNPTRMNGDIYDFENAIEELLQREVMEEAGIKIHEELKYVNNVAFVRPDGIPVMLVKFATKYKSGEVKIEKEAFDDYAWVDEKEIKKYDCIKGVPEEIKKTIKMFK